MNLNNLPLGDNFVIKPSVLPAKEVELVVIEFEFVSPTKAIVSSARAITELAISLPAPPKYDTKRRFPSLSNFPMKPSLLLLRLD